MFAEIKNIKSSKIEQKKFGITIGIILFIIGIILFYKENSLYQNFAISATIFILSGFIIPVLLKPIYLVWMTFAVILGWFMTRLILSVLFFFIMTPIGLIARIFGKDFLNIRNKNSVSSYWNLRDSNVERNQDYEKQF